MSTIIQKIPNPSRRDSIVYGAYLARMGLSALGNTVTGLRKRGPRKMIDDIRRYPWMLSMFNLAKFNDTYNSLTVGRTGFYREASALVLSSGSEEINDLINGFLNRPEETVMHYSISPEIICAMGLNPWMPEIIGMSLPVYDTKRSEAYIDAAENAGIPPDICSMNKIMMGMFLEDHVPLPIAVLSSNLPCDGTLGQYSLVERKFKVPTFRLDVPYKFYGEEAVEYYANQLKLMIAWLEEHTPGRMDWDRMREICEQRNRTAELQFELWDMLRAKPAPMAADVIITSTMLFGWQPYHPRNTKLFEQLVEMTKKNLKKGKGALIDERYRMTLWNPPPGIFLNIFPWIEQTYGIALLMDMLTFHRHPFIDTKTPDTILRDLARVCMQVGMARHTRGPAENFFGDLFHVYEHFDLDMIWMSGHIGCKSSQALFGILREKCRERDIPLLIIDMDIMDTRIVSPAGIQRQVEQFMETVMKAERLLA